ncbi:hypothetical protein MICA_1552 [Micavibrio aeruginosavorus ARL-13]|uniref:Uncharacterized protein n=1 Tax=Micavibrio aeruginosavorus (strain ARL-13) TaxID=856793 RepID=G2KPQ1_MICAA|nr:hypothetical protein MICA_1552 [Micavibrio aeruginosavorus ARL-13]
MTSATNLQIIGKMARPFEQRSNCHKKGRNFWKKWRARSNKVRTTLL